MNRAFFVFLGIGIICHSLAYAEPEPDRDGPPNNRAQEADSARRPRHPMPPLLRALDTDQDGNLSSEEIENAVQSLKALDEDSDGTISRREMRPPPPEGNDRRRPPEDF
ncbi:MAG TPA: hypothetical protein QF761_10270, partial [Pirellulales bacterium]|nr:hypothetical protein [Pirellulales bacterium]